MKRLLILIVLYSMLLPLVSAVNWTTHDQYTAPNITLPCTDYFGSACNSTIKCNITQINYPNGTQLITDQPANFSVDGFFNHQVYLNLSVLGDYYCAYSCIDAASNEGSDTCTFTLIEPWKSTTLMIILFLVSLAGIFTFYSFKFGEEHIFLKLLFYFCIFIILILMINALRIMMPAEISNYANSIYNIVLWTAILSFIYFFIFFVTISFRKRKKEEKDEDEADV